MLHSGDKGVIINNEDNGIEGDDYTWWYVRFSLDYGEYTGWCAGELLKNQDSDNNGFKVGDAVIVNTARLNLRNSPEKMETIDGLNDEYFIRNMELASENGIKVGAYHFGWPDLLLEGEDLKDDAKSEANHFIEVAKEYLTEGNMRPVLDIESIGIGYGTGWGSEVDYNEEIIEKKFEENIDTNRKKLSDWIDEWMKTVESKTGIIPILYTTGNYANNYFSPSVNQYDLWLALWRCNTDNPPSNADTGIWNNWKFWQYYGPSFCGKNSVQGINTPVDLNIYNGDMSSLNNFVINGIEQPSGGDSDTPGFELILFFCAMALVLLCKRKRQL